MHKRTIVTLMNAVLWRALAYMFVVRRGKDKDYVEWMTHDGEGSLNKIIKIMGGKRRAKGPWPQPDPSYALYLKKCWRIHSFKFPNLQLNTLVQELHVHVIKSDVVHMHNDTWLWNY